MVAIEPDGEPISRDPRIIVERDGSATALWRADATGTPEQHASFRDAVTGDWSSPTIIRADTANTVGQLARRGGVSAFSWQSASTADSWVRIHTKSGDWLSAERLTNLGLTGATQANLEINEFGSVLSVWAESDGGEDELWARLYHHGSGWGEAVAIQDGPFVGVESFESAALPGGGFIVLFAFTVEGAAEKGCGTVSPGGEWSFDCTAPFASGDLATPLAMGGGVQTAMAAWAADNAVWASTWELPEEEWSQAIRVANFETSATPTWMQIHQDDLGRAVLAWWYPVSSSGYLSAAQYR